MIVKMKRKQVFSHLKLIKKELFRLNISKVRLRFKFIRFAFKTQRSEELPA